ncbi:MAG: putative GTP-binding protein EngB [Alphaproteobacteria bacterium MarineAlpha3_Bin5]|nr:YihA family ribosome biogenesis GTP-binding protein [Magnetovibrio sp.]PPR78033.1 MAG: putative GTP-binding protein EngB [Alphaproteobacteria bacterium MarineAlpha3_Bin5]|tara:strand:+ start:44 stop:703 length:660 start_codon:yes stop_codon:yes gene_type:complete
MTKSKIFSKTEIREGRLLFSQSCTFLLSATEQNQIPNSKLPEVAFAGRSNVGKSSLINALTNQNGLARTSKTPGRTQQINFFLLGQRLVLTDLPGYGYANAPRNIVANWTHLCKLYLRGRAQLRRCLLLIDSRHGLKPNDMEAMELLDKAAQPYQIILTKCDKINLNSVRLLKNEIAATFSKHTAAHPQVAVSSSTKGSGIDELRASIAALAYPRTGKP